MKIKNDFVTNSSSSSYIFIDKREDKTKSIDMSLTVKNILNTLDNEIIKSIKELDEYFEYHWGKREYWDQTDYQKYKKEIDNGNHIIVLEASSDDGNALSNYMHNNGTENLQIPEGIEEF